MRDNPATVFRLRAEAAEAALADLRQEVTRQAATIAALLEGVECAFHAKIHLYQADETRNYCRCGYYETHPIHTLAALPSIPRKGGE